MAPYALAFGIVWSVVALVVGLMVGMAESLGGRREVVGILTSRQSR